MPRKKHQIHCSLIIDSCSLRQWAKIYLWMNFVLSFHGNELTVFSGRELICVVLYLHVHDATLTSHYVYKSLMLHSYHRSYQRNNQDVSMLFNPLLRMQNQLPKQSVMQAKLWSQLVVQRMVLPLRSLHQMHCK